MFEMHKNYVLNENQQPIAVQIPIAEFEKIEEILENYGLVKLMEEVEDEEKLAKDDALKYYKSLTSKNVES
jgi:RelB Antitoxin alpha helical domain